MKRLGWLVCVLSLAVGAGACGNANEADDNDAARPDVGISGSAGTSGDGTIQAADVDAAPQEARGERGELPNSASWLPLAGIIGLLSMGGALGVRFLRRE